MTSLRPYQRHAVDATLSAWEDADRILGIAPTGSGKTVMAAEIIRRRLERDNGRCLFLADARELVRQAAASIGRHVGTDAVTVEMAEESPDPSARVCVATAQTLALRLDRYPAGHYRTIIIDEAHRNTLGVHPGAVLDHFRGAKLLGITATPHRSDRRELGDVYERTAFELRLPDLIRDGWLAPITIKSVPVSVDLGGVSVSRGDYQAGQLGEAIAPELEALADTLLEHAPDRRTAVFLPTIATSQAFTAALRHRGVNAVHVDGQDSTLLRTDWQVVSNAQLLSTGWDEPAVDCVYILRATRSWTLYCQMVGRGTRIHRGKTDLLLLDPLWLGDKHNLIRPPRLIARDDDEAERIGRALDKGKGGGDLMEAASEAEEERLATLQKTLAASAKKKVRTVDAMALAMALEESGLIDYEPDFRWESQPATAKQLEHLARAGIDPESVTGRGHASKLLDAIFTRREKGLATPKQLKWLARFGIRRANTLTFGEASEILDRCFGPKKTTTKTIVTL